MWIGERAEPAEFLRATATHLHGVFGAHAVVAATAERPQGVLDPRRGQHSSTGVLHWLQAHAHGPGKLLAVTDADLFIPVLTFVYGEAQLGGVAAVVSLARLSEGGTPALVRSRLAKEAVHEVGHLFGLVHCGEPGCAMRRSGSLRDVDGKGSVLCADCRMRLQEAT